MLVLEVDVRENCGLCGVRGTEALAAADRETCLIEVHRRAHVGRDETAPGRKLSNAVHLDDQHHGNIPAV